MSFCVIFRRLRRRGARNHLIPRAVIAARPSGAGRRGHPAESRGGSRPLQTITPPLNSVVTGRARRGEEQISSRRPLDERGGRGGGHTVPFKFIHDKDGQAHQHHRHQHDDCGAAVHAVAGVHQRSFWRRKREGEVKCTRGQVPITAPGDDRSGRQR